ncbi:MAG TPA: hypothetical protein EYG21_02625 [Nitrospinaceae bacterium]|nr:hypothetical protein [Nitrospinaceae bacterium]
MTFKTLLGKRRRIKRPVIYLINWEKNSRSKLQSKVKDFLKVFWDGDVVFEEFPVVGTRLTIDFYNATKNIAIEVQGNQHTKYNKFFHKGNKMNYLDQLKRDDEKLAFCDLNNIKLLEVHEGQIDFDSLYKEIV